eukprot:TRINITY_DN12682_c0_g3_i3.p1 TRINITY_DN12682_c0_g3~~TRINITY_DN12682_c0_g3_i3.p1  ORF type:complete len:240 (-),score=28.20 TRINITY_DN12682_c0_g3_i3:35-754(-)
MSENWLFLIYIVCSSHRFSISTLEQFTNLEKLVLIASELKTLENLPTLDNLREFHLLRCSKSLWESSMDMFWRMYPNLESFNGIDRDGRKVYEPGEREEEARQKGLPISVLEQPDSLFKPTIESPDGKVMFTIDENDYIITAKGFKLGYFFGGVYYDARSLGARAVYTNREIKFEKIFFASIRGNVLIDLQGAPLASIKFSTLREGQVLVKDSPVFQFKGLPDLGKIACIYLFLFAGYY